MILFRLACQNGNKYHLFFSCCCRIMYSLSFKYRPWLYYWPFELWPCIIPQQTTILEIETYFLNILCDTCWEILLFETLINFFTIYLDFHLTCLLGMTSSDYTCTSQCSIIIFIVLERRFMGGRKQEKLLKGYNLNEGFSNWADVFNYFSDLITSVHNLNIRVVLNTNFTN